ncbi:hypothetical protein GP486_005744 [Trichoglossum hirsutum]|uniref:Uncharacterized protein n=1 Tax=Trichoglossum hirsutum TaxID=265104 RepID=A0A9P8L8T0_9PEZI|nr:hypothetical protein GP486_005744 [Trichoglossum hirsutum]
MSLSRSPSPLPRGGWASPGLTSGRSSPSRGSYADHNGSANTVSWASAKAKSDEVKNGYPSFSTRSNSFFGRHARRLSHSLPSFNIGWRKDFAEKEKLGRGRWAGGRLAQMATLAGNIARRMKLRLLLLFGFILTMIPYIISGNALHSSEEAPNSSLF